MTDRLDDSSQNAGASERPVGDPPASYPGVRAPDRSCWVDANGVRLRAYEWGDPGAPSVLLAHGGFDFARTYDQFAPLLADAGWRVVTWDHRGHGDSQHTALYSWDADERDLLAVADACVPEPCPGAGIHRRTVGVGALR